MDESRESPEPWERSGSWAFQLALCLLAPLFFVSKLFTVLSPLPSLYLIVASHDRNLGRFWWLTSLVVGSGVSASIYGWYLGGIGFVVFAAIPSLVLGELLLAKQKLERAVMGALLSIILGVIAAIFLLALVRGQSSLELVRESVRQLEQWFRESAQTTLDQSVVQWSEPNLTAFRQVAENPSIVLPELPGIAISGALLLCILPCLALIRWNPKGFLRRAGIGRDFLRKWRSPEWLIWPAILCLALMLFEVKHLDVVARNFVKPLVLIYFFQGMSILAYFLDSIRLRGPLRVPVYVLGLCFPPVVVSFGFFDLWLNFRNRHRSGSGEAEEDKES